jgi:hypothetical protein
MRKVIVSDDPPQGRRDGVEIGGAFMDGGKGWTMRLYGTAQQGGGT